MKPKYVWLKRKNYKGEIIKNSSWEEDIPTGWHIAFGEKMIKELNKILIQGHYQKKYTIVQVKEKFGGLRWYDNGVPLSMLKDYYAWMHKYEDLSEVTCIYCGQPGTMRQSSWISPYCDECWAKYK